MAKFATIGIIVAGAICGYAQNQPPSNKFFVRPAATQFSPMTEKQRFHLFLKRTFGPEAFVKSAAGAGIGLWDGRPYEWRQGAEGFGKRYLSSFATHITETTLEFGLSSLLDEDNRYFVSDRTGTGSRFAYAIESTFLARHHDGTRRVSASRISSIVGAAFIARAWQPSSTRGPGEACLSVLALTGSAAGLNIVREFWPRRH